MKSDGNERLEWRRIGEKERIRRKSLDELRNVMQNTDVGTKKTPRSLLLLVLHGHGITVNDAANMLSVSRTVVLSWMKLLKDRKLIETEGLENVNPLMKPTKALAEKLRLYNQRRVTGAPAKESTQEGFKKLEKEKTEFISERDDRIKLGEELEKKDAELKERGKDQDREHNIRVGLEEQIMRLEGQIRGGETSEVEELRVQLERERRERASVEELLKREREDLRRARQEISDRYLQKEKELSEREEGLVEKEKSLMDDEELEILFGEDVGYETLLSKSKKLLGILHRRIVEKKEIPVDGRTDKDLRGIIEEEEELGKLFTEDARQLREKRLDLLESGLGEERGRVRPIENIKAMPEDIREFVKLLEGGAVRVPNAAEALGVSEERIVEWTAMLLQKKAVQVRRHIAGGDEIRLIDKTNLEKLKEELDAEDIELQLRNVMEEEKHVK